MSNEEDVIKLLEERPEMLERVLNSNPGLIVRFLQHYQGSKIQEELWSPEISENYQVQQSSSDTLSQLYERFRSSRVPVKDAGTEPMGSEEEEEEEDSHRTGSGTSLNVVRNDDSRSKRVSMTSELFHLWLSSSPIKRSRSPNK